MGIGTMRLLQIVARDISVEENLTKFAVRSARVDNQRAARSLP